MTGPSDQEKLSKAREMLETIETTLAKLYAKTASSTSFGDQSQTQASIEQLEGSRDKWRREIEGLEEKISGSRRTLKIQFR